MNIIVDPNNVVLMYSEKSVPVPDAGCRLIQLTQEQNAAFLALSTDRSGVTFDGNTFVVIPAQPWLPLDLSNVDNVANTLKALALLLRDYCNALKAGTYTAKSVSDLKADFKAKFNSLP